MYQFSKFCMYWILLLFTIEKEIESQHQTQFLSLWSSQGCTGSLLATPTDSYNYTISQGIGTIHYRINGLWAISLCNNETSCPLRFIQSGANASCQILSIQSDNTRLMATRFGDANQNERTITFFESIDLAEQSFSLDESGDNFNKSRTALSYYFSGDNEWEYSSGENISCLRATDNVRSKGYGFTYSTASVMELDSVKHGCTPSTISTTSPTTDSATSTASTTRTSSTTQSTTTSPTTMRATTENSVSKSWLGPFYFAYSVAVFLSASQFI